MPSQDAKRAGLSRRNLLQGAATAGAAGLAVTAMGAAAPALAATATGTGTDTGSPPAADHGHHADAGPIMVHVRDARSGDIEVFAGTSQTRLRDQDLAARIARAIG